MNRASTEHGSRDDDHGSPLFATLREACRDDWDAYTRHRFVNDLASGELPESLFLDYLRQDYLFLVHFARAWALAVVKSDRIDEMRTAAATVHALIDTEMQLHVNTCREAGIDEATLAATEEATTTLAYTRFVIATGVSGDLLDLLVALLPCVMGYGEIGRRLADERAPDTPYGAWIDTYAGDDYQSVCRKAATLLESVAARRIGRSNDTASTESPRLPELVGLFRNACRLERDFWTLGHAR